MVSAQRDRKASEQGCGLVFELVARLLLGRRVEGVLREASERDVDRQIVDPGGCVDDEVIILNTGTEYNLSSLVENLALVRSVRGERKRPIDRRSPDRC